MRRINNIEKFRKKKHLSQKELANLLNVKQSTISDWEREYRNPSIKKAIKLADILETTVEELYK